MFGWTPSAVCGAPLLQLNLSTRSPHLCGPLAPPGDVQPPGMAARKRFRSAHDPALALGDPLVPAAARRRLLAGSQFDVNHWTRQTAHRAHHSCVNALALSPGSARFLASAGDDHRVLLWDSASPDLDPHTGLAPDPVASYTGALVRPALSRPHPVSTTDFRPRRATSLRSPFPPTDANSSRTPHSRAPGWMSQ